MLLHRTILLLMSNWNLLLATLNQCQFKLKFMQEILRVSSHGSISKGNAKLSLMLDFPSVDGSIEI